MVGPEVKSHSIECKIKINPALLSGDKMLIAYKLYDTNECLYGHVLCVCLNCMCVANVFVCVCVCTCLYCFMYSYVMHIDVCVYSVISLFL